MPLHICRADTEKASPISIPSTSRSDSDNGPDYFKATVNTFLMGVLHQPTDRNLDRGLGHRVDWYAGHVLPFRACVYILKTDSHTRRASRDRNAGVLRPIDEIIAAISVHRRAGGKVQRKAWLHYLAGWIGEADAETRFRDMMAGKVMELGDMKSSFGDIHEPVAMDQEVLCWGMDPASFEKGLVHGLVAGSRAEIAGLSEGAGHSLAHPAWIVCHEFQREDGGGR